MKKIDWKQFSYCLFLAVLFLTICTKSSPLYKINDWVDAQAFFTVGKSMVRGTIPYLELFEQKGPLLYLIYGIGSIIDYNSFFGIYLLEIISCTICFYYTSKILSLYCSKKSSILLLPIFAGLILSLRSFTHGGSAEEFCFPFLSFSLYRLLEYFKNGTIFKKDVFFVGICAGCVLWIKYSLLGFWFAWMMVVFLLLVSDRKWKEGFLNCFIYLAGMMIVSIPWFIYFGIHNAIPSLIEVYFTFNMKLYASSLPFIDKFKNCCFNIVRVFHQYKIFYLFIIIPILLSFLFSFPWKRKRYSVALFTCLLFLTLGIFIGGTYYRYYSLLIAPFIVIGLIGIGIYLDKIKWQKEYFIIAILLTITSSFLFAFHKSPNTAMIFLDKEDYAQFTFAEIINKEEHPTLLNYGFLDGGFYSTTGIMPNCYFFMRNNISHRIFPKLLDEQRRYVRDGKVDFVVVRGPLSEHHTFLDQNYQVVSKKSQKFQGKLVEYILFRKKIMI